MKRLLLIFGMMLMLTSCEATLTSRIENFVENAENKCEQWTDEDWEMSQERYQRLLDEYEDNYSQLSQEERNAINKAIGRYNGMIVKKGINNMAKSIEDFGERLPSLIEGFMSAFEEEGEEYKE